MTLPPPPSFALGRRFRGREAFFSLSLSANNCLHCVEIHSAVEEERDKEKQKFLTSPSHSVLVERGMRKGKSHHPSSVPAFACSTCPSCRKETSALENKQGLLPYTVQQDGKKSDRTYENEERTTKMHKTKKPPVTPNKGRKRKKREKERPLRLGREEINNPPPSLRFPFLLPPPPPGKEKREKNCRLIAQFRHSAPPSFSPSKAEQRQEKGGGEIILFSVTPCWESAGRVLFCLIK